MNVLARFEAVLLTAVAAFHVAWGFGVRWPCHDEQALVALVVGHTRACMPSPVQCFVAAAAILAAAIVVALLAGGIRIPVAPQLVGLAGAGVTAVFAGRGIAGYLPAWRAHFPRQPFATLDRRVYSPLCLGIAATRAFLLITSMGS